MLDRILSKENMTQAYKRVVSNGGACGIDGMKASELQSYLNQAWVFLKVEILEGKYEPKAVRRVEIPKPNGGKRMLGIPTILDRLLQQAISQQLTPLWERKFSESSYGFRPKRNAHQALKQAESYINAGRTYIVDIDLEKFFDRVQHDYLMQLVSKEVKDKLVLKLIGKYLKSGAMINGVKIKSEEGTPQGSPLSPILSNILLDELDKELEQRGHKFVRYADDFSIYCKSRKSAERVMSSIKKFIEKELHLKINEEKSGIRRPSTMYLLGYGFYAKQKGKWGLRLSPKAVKRMKEKVREITERKRPQKTEERAERLCKMQMGWIAYFKLADCNKHLKELDEWTRSRLRMCEWKLWKQVRTRIKRLIELGVKREQAYQWGNTRKGYWRIAHSPILTQTLSNKWLETQGYVSLKELYKKLKIVV